MERTIRVTGTGRVSLKPDLTIIRLSFKRVLPTYEEALEGSLYDVNEVRYALMEAGLSKDSVKTTDFEVGINYKYYYDEKGNRQSKPDGYFYRQSLKVTFGVDNKLLGKVLYQLAKLDVNSEFDIYYGVKDTEQAKNELLAKAIEDSKKKAEIISKSAGVTLGDILDINYSWLDDEFRTSSYDFDRPMLCKSVNERGGFDVDIDPDDIEKSDNITVVYQIK